MRRSLLSLVLVLPGLLLGCGEDPPPLFADIVWHVQCKCYGMCSGIDPHDINNIDGEDGHDISCSVYESGGNDVLTFTASKGTEYSIEVRGAQLTSGGSVAGAGCRVRVEEGGNTYEGVCGSSQPSEAQPCRVYDVVIDEDEDGNPQISGKLLCLELPATSDSTRRREVSAPNSPIDTSMDMCRVLPETEPVRWRMVNCSGL